MILIRKSGLLLPSTLEEYNKKHLVSGKINRPCPKRTGSAQNGQKSVTLISRADANLLNYILFSQPHNFQKNILTTPSLLVHLGKNWKTTTLFQNSFA